MFNLKVCFGGMFRGMLQSVFRRYVWQIHKQHLIFCQCFEGMIRGYDSTYVSDDVKHASHLKCLALAGVPYSTLGMESDF